MGTVVRLKGAAIDESPPIPHPTIIFLPAVLVAVLSGPSSGHAENDGSTEQQIAAVQSKMDEAVARVKAIVNRPVNPLPRTSDMSVAVFRPGWFHENAIPSFGRSTAP